VTFTNVSEDRSRLYPARPRLCVSLAVFREGRVLLARRTAAPYAGAFSLPGGLVETGETLADAALRELREEVAVEARIIGFNQHVELINRDEEGKIRDHYVVASFVAEWILGDGTPGPEASEIIWSDVSGLEDLNCTPHVTTVVTAAARILAETRRNAP
jgi:8-oxo-dGTP diphosphatase